MREGSPTAGEIERDLDQTRARLDVTLGELEQMLAPGSVVEEAMRAARSRVGAMMDGASGLAGALAGRGQAAAHNVYGYGASAASGVHDMGGRTVDYVQDRPLLLGALGVTVGAVIGVLVPASRYERRVAGSLRQHVGETACDGVTGRLERRAG